MVSLKQDWNLENQRSSNLFDNLLKKNIKNLNIKKLLNINLFN